VQLMSDEPFERSPEPAWMQECVIAGGENDVSLVAAVVDLIRSTLCDGAALDAEMLFDYLESQQAGESSTVIRLTRWPLW